MARDRLSLCLSLERIAPSQYANYNFNSMCNFGGASLGANEDGIFVLDNGDKDITTDILAFFRLATTDWGTDNLKKIRKLYLGYECDGAVEVNIAADESEDLSTEVRPRHKDLREHSQKVSIGRDLKGRFWELEIRNINGADFSIDSISVVPIILGTKPEEGV